jgi:hypothetical protein
MSVGEGVQNLVDHWGHLDPTAPLTAYFVKGSSSLEFHDEE